MHFAWSQILGVAVLSDLVQALAKFSLAEMPCVVGILVLFHPNSTVGHRRTFPW